MPLDPPLKTGARVEILTHKEPQPSRDWMNPSLGYLQTTSARNKVRQWFRNQGREEAVVHGRELVERELARLDLRHATIEQVAEALKYPGAEERYAAVGYGDRSTQSVTSAALSIELEKAAASAAGDRGGAARAGQAGHAGPPDRRHRRGARPPRPLLQPGAALGERRAERFPVLELYVASVTTKPITLSTNAITPTYWTG